MLMWLVHNVHLIAESLDAERNSLFLPLFVGILPMFHVDFLKNYFVGYHENMAVVL